MKKFLVPIILFLIAAGVVVYLIADVPIKKSSFDAVAYLQAREKIDSLQIALWEASKDPNAQLTIRTELESSWEVLNSMRNIEPNLEKDLPKSGIPFDTMLWIVSGIFAVVVCLILLFALAHRKRVLTQKMEAIKAEQRFKEPKNGFENDPTIAPRARPQKKSIIEEASEFAETKVAFEDENGIPENKILSTNLNERPQLRPTAKERITSAMQSLSDVLRSPRGLSRDRTMKLRAQSRNMTGNPSLQGSSPLDATRFDKEFTEKNKILQMSRRGFPASAIASQLKIPQEQVESIIKKALDSGN